MALTHHYDAGSGRLGAWGRLIYRRRWWVLAAWLLLLPPGIWLSSSLSQYLTLGGYDTSKTESQRALDRLAADLGYHAPAANLVLYDSRLAVSDPAYQAEVAAWMVALRRAPGVISVSLAPPSPDGHGEIIDIRASDNFDTQLQLGGLWETTPPVAGPVRAYLSGTGPVFYDINAVSASDLRHSETYSGPLALVALLIIFGTLVAAGVPVLAGLCAVVLSLASLSVLGRSMTISTFAQNTTTLLGLGIGIDYSLLIVNRFREELMRGAEGDVPGSDVPAAIARTLGTAGHAVLFSGLTVLVGFIGLNLMGVVTIRSIGLGGALVVAWSVLGAMTLIPAVLSILGPRVNRLRVLAPLRFGRQRRMAPLEEVASSGGFWHRLALRVMRHPIPTLIGAMLILLLLASPIVAMRMGVPDGHILPARLASRQGLDLLDKHFAAASPGATAAVRLDAPVLSQRGRAELTAYVEQLRATLGVDHVRSALDAYSAVIAAMPAPATAQLSSLPPAADPLPLLPAQVQGSFKGMVSGGSTVVSVFLKDDVQTPGADATTDRLRAIHSPAGVDSLIGGNEPYDLDFIRVLYADFPKAVGFTLLATFFLLLIMLRSVVLPLKAIAMNLISLGASFGAMVFLFQQGHAAGLLGFIPVSNVAATIPIIMFATQFGLSMDYEVFLLSRIREEYLRSGDNEAAVARGLELTGRIITSAALVMVVVFGFFAFAELVIMKEIGVGLAVAILVDATIVRALLVPATMRLLGRANWWPGLRGRVGLAAAQPTAAGEAA